LGLQSVFNGLVPRATTTWVRVRELGGGCFKEEKGRLKSLSSISSVSVQPVGLAHAYLEVMQAEAASARA